MRSPVLSLVFVLLGAASASAGTPIWIVSSTGQGVVNLSGNGATELSGLTWAAADQYYAVSDNDAKLYPLTIQIDPATGTILAVNVSPAIQLATGSDLEGVAYNAANSSVFASDESGPAIRQYSLADGSLLQTLTIPAVFAGHRSNLSLESLSLQPGQALWTANEEALSSDGPVSSFTEGTTVRLQKFDAGLSAAGQWAYVTDAIPGDLGNNGRDIEVSGVADLLALPNGDLLVMERALGASPFGFRIRLYQVDLTGASDVSALPGLAGQSFTPVTKMLLWEGHFNANNFEGIALGPALSGGVYSLVLVSDDGSGLLQGLYALTLAPPPCEPTPRGGCQVSQRSALSIRRIDGTRDKLAFSWRRGVVESPSSFGDPTVAGGTPFAVCVYDTPSGAPTLAWSARVAAGSDWRTAGSRGYRYRERTGVAGGVVSFVARNGTGNASLVVRGRGVNLRLPSDPPNPMLQQNPDVIVQVVNLDDPGECFTALYPSARSNTADRYKARF